MVTVPLAGTSSTSNSTQYHWFVPYWMIFTVAVLPLPEWVGLEWHRVNRAPPR